MLLRRSTLKNIYYVSLMKHFRSINHIICPVLLWNTSLMIRKSFTRINGIYYDMANWRTQKPNERQKDRSTSFLIRLNLLHP